MTPFTTAMRLLASQPRAIFVGQGVAADGIAQFDDFDGIPMEQRLEFPVAEELNLGYGIGLAMTGYLPILQYPRIDFLLRAMDSLVNHLDKMEVMTRGAWKPKVIIRTRVGKKTPLNAGPQHTQRHADAFRLMLTNIDVVEITLPSHILPVYNSAINSDRSTIIVEDLA